MRTYYCFLLFVCLCLPACGFPPVDPSTPPFDFSTSRAWITGFTPASTGTTELLGDCEGKPLICCDTNAITLPFRLNGLSVGVEPNGANKTGGFLHVFLKPITSSDGPWFIQNGKAAEIESNGNWEINANYGDPGSPPQDGDQFRVKIIISDQNLYTHPDTTIRKLEDLDSIKSYYRFEYQEWCDLTFSVQKPC